MKGEDIGTAYLKLQPSPQGCEVSENITATRTVCFPNS